MSLYGALAYNYEKVAAGTAEILSGNRMISDRLGLPSEDIRLALLSFENYLLANRNTEKPVLHISLSPAPEDRLTDGRLAELAERYMQKMGYGNQPYITYKHADTHNTHIHIVSVCVNEQGKKISDAYEYRRSMTACRELEVDFGLRNGADAERRNPKAELRKVDASLGDVRHQIGNTLKPYWKATVSKPSGNTMRCFPRSTSRRNRSGENTTVHHIPVLSIRSRMIPARLSAHRSRVPDLGNASEMNSWKSGC